jgi:FlaA1/EpsC-like NDP-sugar epimerase
VLNDFSDAPQTVRTPSWADLLGRDVSTRDSGFIPGVASRRVLVTGAGGFIGARMVHALADSGASQIVLLDIAEQALFDVDRAMAASGYGDRSIPILGSVCDRAVLTALFDEYRPEIVVHAAALKHVPLMERNPFAAVETNSIGTWLLAQIAREHGVRRMILISTDKAVAPHSIMGASKRIAELAMLAYPEFAAVRLVNVIGSPGSVAPLFAEQIAQGRPVTVTHPSARRFFFTLDEVVALLAEAMDAESAQGILVPDPGEPVLIADLARRMIETSSGASGAGEGLPVVFTEPRPGDKLGEALVSLEESYAGWATPALRRVASPKAKDLDAHMRSLESAVVARDLPLLLCKVSELVPDYLPSAFLQNAAAAFAASR